jgi:hypothetical protein
MAIDSQVKRASVLFVVQPDGSIEQRDRQTVVKVYGGISAGELVRSPWKHRRNRAIAAFRRRI